jgi:hypothetical protein
MVTRSLSHCKKAYRFQDQIRECTSRLLVFLERDFNGRQERLYGATISPMNELRSKPKQLEVADGFEKHVD